MKAQFHLPLATYPDASSFSLLQNAVDFSLHQKAGLTASIPLVRIEPVQPRFPSLLDVANMRAEAERLSKDNGTVLGQTLRDYAKKAEVEVEIQPFDVRQPFVAQTLAELSRSELAAQSAITDENEPNFLPSECILHFVRHCRPLVAPRFVIALAAFKALADLIDFAHGRGAVRNHFDRRHETLRPHETFRKVLEPVFVLLLGHCMHLRRYV